VPEGDTLWRVANRLSPVLAGRRVTALRLGTPALTSAARRHRVEGSTVLAVEARGKHLLVRFSTGVALHTHLGMTGSWHLYRAGSRWRQPAHLARVVLEADGVVAVCFVPRVVELVAEKDEGAHPSLTALGPDVVSEGFDAASAVTRLQARGPVAIGAALLDQTALSGIGNIYKSEVLFLCGVDPFTPVAALDAERLRRIVETAHERCGAAWWRRFVGPPAPPGAAGTGSTAGRGVRAAAARRSYEWRAREHRHARPTGARVARRPPRPRRGRGWRPSSSPPRRRRAGRGRRG
jgi:endonuclease-8